MKVLIVDDEPDILEILRFFFESKWKANVEEAASGAIAIQKLSSDERFDLVVCDYNMPGINGGGVFKHIQTMVTKPKYIMLSSDLPEDHPEIIPAEIAGYAPKPLFSGPLNDIVSRLSTSSSQSDSVKEIFCPVNIELLHKMNVVPCDLYIKISDEKMIKVLNAGEVFGDSDLEKYSNKRVAYLYISREHIDEATHKLIRAIRQLENKFDSNATPPAHIRISEALQNTISEMASEMGFSAALESLVKANMEIALGSLEKNPELAHILKSTLSDPENYLARHSVLLPFVAAHFAELMEWHSSQTFQKLIIASFLHDATISDDSLAKVQREADLSNFSAEQAKIWRVHTLLASEIARQFTEIPPDVDLIIAQHHELASGDGSPNGLSHSRIAPLAALFIIAQDFLLHFESSGNLDLLSFVECREDIYSVGHFKRILAAIRKSQSRA